MADQKVLFEIRDLTKQFKLPGKRTLTAVNHVSFQLYSGEKFGVVGESGCGKSTLGRTILQLNDATSGKVIYHGKATDEISPKYLMEENLRKYQAEAIALHKKAQACTDPEEAKALDKQAEAKLEAGAEFAGSLIISKQLERCVEQLTQAENQMHAAAKLSTQLADLQQEAESNTARPELSAEEIEKINVPLLEQERKLKEQIQAYWDKAEDYRQAATARDEADYLEITPACATQEYRDYLDSLCTSGLDLCRLTPKEMQTIRHDLQMIFQDPAASLDPRMTVGKSIEEALRLNTKLSAKARKNRTLQLLERVGLKREHYDSYPHALSGGQKQRVGIARAIAVYPEFIVLDEAVSALDVSVKAQILQLLNEIKAERNVTYFFITHDLGVAKHFCDRIMVMYLGNICELAPSKELFHNSLHPYTKSLLASVPRMRTDISWDDTPMLTGEVPSPINPPSGCPFHTRCDQCMEICSKERPEYREVLPGHFVACHLYDHQEEAK